MSAPPRYAEGTKVAVDSSRGEITGILAKHGVERMAWATGPEGDQLQFELAGQRYMFRMLKPTLREVQSLYPNAYDHNAKMAGEWRRRWRANVLLIKAKLEFVASGDTTMEREFMPYLLIAGNQTLADWMETASGQKLLAAG